MEAANPRHAHEWHLWEHIKLPAGKILIPGVVGHDSDTIEHPALVAERLCNYASVVGRDHVIAGTDCGFGTSRLHPTIAYLKLQTLVEARTPGLTEALGPPVLRTAHTARHPWRGETPVPFCPPFQLPFPAGEGWGEGLAVPKNSRKHKTPTRHMAGHGSLQSQSGLHSCTGFMPIGLSGSLTTVCGYRTSIWERSSSAYRLGCRHRYRWPHRVRRWQAANRAWPRNSQCPSR